MRRRIALAILALLLLASCRGAAYRDNHFTTPVEYYFTYPDTTGLHGAPALVIGLLGKGHSPLDCIDLFQQFAKDRHFALLCPKLGGRAGLSDQNQAERDLADILAALYRDHTFRDKFYFAGFGDGGDFALEYGMKYPTAVSGVSAMSVDTYPEVVAGAGLPPVQLLVGESDTERMAAAQKAEEAWRPLGILVRLVTVAGNGRQPSKVFARLASELIDQIDLMN